MSPHKKIYFASDFHLGTPDIKDNREREKRIVSWLEHIRTDAEALYLLGDIFDFWFEYKHAVPKGAIRFLGKLSELADQGIKITLFKGNHDMWMFGYLKEELGVEIIDDALRLDCNGKAFYLHHGDGLGAGDRAYKLLKKIFRSPICQWLFARLHPNLGIGIARAWSRRSRLASGQKETFQGAEKEWLVAYAKSILQTSQINYFIFGHRHLPLDISLSPTSRYINLGEWIHYNTYAVFDGVNLELKTWDQSST